MKGRQTGRGRKKALTLLLIFISSTLAKKRPLKALVEFFHTVFINPDMYA